MINWSMRGYVITILYFLLYHYTLVLAFELVDQF
jgi:hypothetical protein